MVKDQRRNTGTPVVAAAWGNDTLGFQRALMVSGYFRDLGLLLCLLVMIVGFIPLSLSMYYAVMLGTLIRLYE